MPPINLMNVATTTLPDNTPTLAQKFLFSSNTYYEKIPTNPAEPNPIK